MWQTIQPPWVRTNTLIYNHYNENKKKSYYCLESDKFVVVYINDLLILEEEILTGATTPTSHQFHLSLPAATI